MADVASQGYTLGLHIARLYCALQSPTERPHGPPRGSPNHGAARNYGLRAEPWREVELPQRLPAFSPERTVRTAARRHPRPALQVFQGAARRATGVDARKALECSPETRTVIRLRSCRPEDSPLGLDLSCPSISPRDWRPLLPAGIHDQQQEISARRNGRRRPLVLDRAGADSGRRSRPLAPPSPPRHTARFQELTSEYNSTSVTNQPECTLTRSGVP
jgi:hypothetical protein